MPQYDKSMNRQTFASYPSRKLLREEFWLDFLCFSGLFLAAALLFLVNLDSLPLRDWDEGIIAQVAKEIYQAPPDSHRWIFPTLWGEFYFNKPPLLHNLIALFYSLGGVNESMSRLPGALLTAISVPLLYALGREIFPYRRPAIFSALVYLTLLPVVRHGRLAMLDGTILFLEILLFWTVLRSRRDLRWTLGVGFSLGLIFLTKGMLAVLLGAIAFLFLLWDTPRILSSFYLWIGLFLGSLPALAWYTAQFYFYGTVFAEHNLQSQFLERIYTEKEGNTGPIWYYFWEIVKYSLPYFVFFLAGLRLSWQNRNWSWAKFILVWSFCYFVIVSLMVTKLPWYILPIYPALALAAGVKLDQLYNLPEFSNYSRLWKILFSFIAFVASFGAIYFAFFSNNPEEQFLAIICLAIALTMGTVAILLIKRQRQFIAVLFWGMYISLLLFVNSFLWNWELNEAYQVKPVAEMIREAQVSESASIYTSFPYERPSLNFYSNHRIIPIEMEALPYLWSNAESIYLLIDSETKEQLSLTDAKLIAQVDDWLLIRKNN